MHLSYFFAFVSRLECLHGITFGWRPLREEMETGEGGRGGHQVASLVSLSSFNGLQPKVIS